jgi:hypothetical protein
MQTGGTHLAEENGRIHRNFVLHGKAVNVRVAVLVKLACRFHEDVALGLQVVKVQIRKDVYMRMRKKKER